MTLIDKNNYQQFQPLLYQVASGLLAPSNAAFPLRGEHCHELTGPIAFAAWLGVHAALLTTTNAKVGTVMDWAWNYSARSVVSRFQITQEDMRSIGTRTKNKSRLRLTLRHSEPAQD